jgi:hypothetical protein
MSTISLDLRKAEAIRKEKAIAIASGEGIKYGLIGLLLGGGILVATRKSNFFMKYMSVSAKTSIPVMMGLFGFSLKYELVLIDASK